MRMSGKDHFADFGSLKEYLTDRKKEGWTVEQAWAFTKKAKVAIIMVRLDEHPNVQGIIEDLYKWKS